MKGRSVPQRPRWHAAPQAWQAELLANPHLTPGEKVTALALSKRFTGWGRSRSTLTRLHGRRGRRLKMSAPTLSTCMVWRGRLCHEAPHRPLVFRQARRLLL